MSKEENDKILEYDNGCTVKINKEGTIAMTKCPILELGANDIDMLKKIKDVVIE